MAQTTTMTIRVPIEIMNRLTGVSRSTERSKSYLANKAIEEFLDGQEWQISAIEEAVKEADAPDADFQNHVDVLARMKKKVAAARKMEKK